MKKALKEENWTAWLKAEAREQAEILLGAVGGLSNIEEERVDLATQTFLCGAERLRVNSLGLPSFRSKVGQGARDGPGDPTREELDLLYRELDGVMGKG